MMDLVFNRGSKELTSMKTPRTASPSGLSAAFSGVPYCKKSMQICKSNLNYSDSNLGVVVNNVELSVVLFPIDCVLAAMPSAGAPVGVHLPNLKKIM